MPAISHRWQACTAELYRGSIGGDWAGADRLNATLAALERGRTAIERIPTWPWRPETLRSVVAALVLPVVIGLFQYGLKKFWVPDRRGPPGAAKVERILARGVDLVLHPAVPRALASRAEA